MKKYFFAFISLVVANATRAQSLDSLTDKDYAHAESMLFYNTTRYIDHGTVMPQWINGDKFWYRTLTPQGSNFILVDAAKGNKAAAFDEQKLAAALSAETGKTYTAANLPFTDVSYADDLSAISFTVNGKPYNFNLKTYKVTNGSMPADSKNNNRNEEVSPDGKLAAFIKDYNLWVRDIATGVEKQLTTHGEQYFGYATDNAGWKHSDAPILRWSPDSKKIATFQQDERKAGNMYLVSTNVGHPKLESWKYPLPGDSNIITIERVIINVEEPKVIRLDVAPDPHRASLSDDISSSGTFDDVDWTADGKQLAFVSTSRDHKQEKFCIADAETGKVREVFEETVPTQYESGQGDINWKYLAATNEIIWYSERDNYGHLYLYDAISGKLKNKITTGNYVVTKTPVIDEKNREIYFIAVGADTANPYYSHLFKIGFDGKKLTALTPETGDHRISFSPDDKYFVDNYSQPDVPGIAVLRNADGKLISTLEKTDISRLTATGWKAPMPVKLKAADDTTDIYGLMFTPSHLDSSKKYPVIDYIYPGPQGGSVGSWSFSAGRGDHQALAELGFIVVLIEGTSNPLRTKSFHDMSYGHMAVNTLPDQVAGIRQLAAKYGYLDTNHVGIWGHSGGGFATACAMFTYPDFFKVGISESGNHDNRNYEDDWGERYIGLETFNSDSVSNYEDQANQVHAKNLKGKLLLAHGLMDDNVPPYNTLLVVQALEEANKDYDLIIFPNSHHGYGPFSYYMMRRRWDYFVKNLAGKQPPKEYLLQPNSDPRNAGRYR